MIPIFIIVHNQLEILKKSVESYEKQIGSPIQIIFHNTCSTYEPTIEYLHAKKTEGYLVYDAKVNHHHTVMESVRDFMAKHPECEYYVITDPDIELFDVKSDILEFFIFLLETLKLTSAGPALKIDDIPDHYPRKANVLAGHGRVIWSKPQQTIKFKDNEYKYIKAPMDTTFQLRSRKNLRADFPHDNSVRCLHPYSARHLDWYINPADMPPCVEYCLNNQTSISHWGNNKWGGSYHGTTVKPLV